MMAHATVVSPSGATTFAESPAVVAALADLAVRTGLPFLGFESDRGVCFQPPGIELPCFLPTSVWSGIGGINGPSVLDAGSGLTVYALPLPATGGRFVAFGYQLEQGVEPPSELCLAARETGWSQRRFERWMQSHPRCSAAPLLALLRIAASDVCVEGDDFASPESQIAQLTGQLEHTYEEIALLHTLTRNLQVSRSPADLVTLCLDRMPELIDAELHFVQLRLPGEGDRVWSIGAPLLENDDASELLARLDSQSSSRPIVRNFLAGSMLESRFPALRNLVAVPIREGHHRFGWILSANLSGGREFGTVEANCLNTIATILGTHARNIHLLQEQNDLLLGFVRSFVSTLDAKDPYTRGHSERVALIARRIGQQMGRPDDELKTIYLSGLLHDVGKIGVDDQILRKNGPLTDDEFAQVKMHPVIGYNILSSLKNLRHVLPGVRNHHESYDGSGYPDALSGEDIPLLARVLAVADAYDAMGSDRPYRRGMPADRIDEIFQHGSNRQWDGTVLNAYFACREDVLSICNDYSLEFGHGVDEPTVGPSTHAPSSGSEKGRCHMSAETERELQPQSLHLAHHAGE